jgi:hypothetical protein
VILDGAIVWPQHVQTNSHFYQSLLFNNLEVNAFGKERGDSHFYQSLLFNNLEVNAFGKERGGGKDEQIYCNDY